MDFKYTVRVRLQNGTFVEMPIYAKSSGQAQMIVESQFGPGSFLGCIDTDYAGDQHG